MARLTRMQKYADLREQLSSSKEETSTSQELKVYEDKFANVQDTLAPKQSEDRNIYSGLDNVIEIREVSIDDNLNTTEVETKEDIVQTNEMPFTYVGDSIMSEVNKQNDFEVNERSFDDTNNNSQDENVNIAQEASQATYSYFDSFVNDVKDEPSTNTFSDFDSYFNQVISETKVEEPSVQNEDTFNIGKVVENDDITNVFNDVNDDSGEIVSQKERDTYLNQTFSDVNQYNIGKGELTIDELLNNSIDEIRHPKQEDVSQDFESEVKNNDEINKEEFLDADKIDTNIVEDNNVDDEEFSNTVSLEISKIMEEISATTNDNIVVEEPNREPEVQEDLQQDVVDEEVIEEEQRIEEKPEEVVEIKNISELENENTHTNTMSTTIPFVVTEDNDVDDEEDEENGSNTVLNVILIVLIVILVAVLGLIVFYILKTKGIF